VIILDEPTIGLDPKQIIDVRNLIKSLAGDHTVILSTHILSEVSMTCNRVAIINQGKIVATGSPEILTKQLAQQTSYEIQTSATLEQARSVLSQVTGVVSVELNNADQSKIDRVNLRVLSNIADDISRELVSALVTQDLGLYEIRRKQTSLEDVFLQVTGKNAVVDPAQEESK
jgi:ABC-2 type transport system ATP-binding protein